jgi:ABC-type transport system substrate-binding protein
MSGRNILALLVLVVMSVSLIGGCGSGPAVPAEPTKVSEVEVVAQPTQAAEATTAPEPTKVLEPTAAAEPKRGGILVYGLSVDPKGMDPHTPNGSGDATIVNLIYSHLVQLGPNLELLPDLAESWEVVDDTTIDFKLREGVKFHNGEELTSEDVKFSFERIQDPDVGSSAAGPFKGIKFETPDKYTIRFLLPQPDASIFQNLTRTDALIVNKAFVESGADLTLTEDGTGPFKYKNREPNVFFELERFDDYYDQPLPYLDGIKFVPYTDETAKVTGFRTGVMDIIDAVPWRHMDQIEKDAEAGKAKFYSGTESLFMLLYYDSGAPPFNDKRVRQALAWAHDREAYGKSTMFGRGKAMTGSFIPEGFLGYDPSLDGTYGYDPDKARQLLDEAGWKDEDGDGTREAHGVEGVEDGTPFKVNIVAAGQYDMHRGHAELLQALLMDVGIQGELVLLDWPPRVEKRSNVEPFEIQVDGLGPSITDSAFMDEYFSSERGLWPARLHFANPEIDKLLDEARASYDPEERAALYHQVDLIALDEAYFVTVWRREQGEATQPYVNGFSHVYSVNAWITLPWVWLDK